MSRGNLLYLWVIIALVLMVSCSGEDSNSIAPTSPAKEVVAIADEATTLLGFYQVTIDKATHNVDIVNIRDGNLAINVLRFLEPPPLVGMTIDFGSLTIDEQNSLIEVNVILTHPIPDPSFMGFDVRGVVFGPVVDNADGLTVIMSPEFFTGEAFGYQDGLLGVPASMGNYTGLAGYKYFADGLGKHDYLTTFFSNQANVDNRGVFSDGSVLSRHYVLDWRDVPQDFFVFNYAIYANYDWPVGSPPITISDFNIATSNSAEAFCMRVTETANALYYIAGSGGGWISLQVEAWDWLGNIANVTLESADGIIIPQVAFDTSLGAGSTSASYLYEFIEVPGTPTETGDLDLIITVTDAVTFGDAWFLGLLNPGNPLFNIPVYNAFVYTTSVSDCPTVVSSSDPNNGWVGQNLDDVTIDGVFINGGFLAVRLSKSGQADINATDVNFVSGNAITCDFDLASAATGDWDVVVTNGCGSEDELLAGFEIQDCANLSGPTSGTSHWTGTPRLTYWPPQPVQVANTRVMVAYTSSSFCTINFTNSTVYDITYNNPPYTIYETCITSDDRLFYSDSNSMNGLHYVDYGASGFTNVRTSWGSTIPGSGYVYRLAIDGNDNPIVLAAIIGGAEIYHWNGTDWGQAIPVPGAIHGFNPNYINDFAYDPSTGYYYIVERYGSVGVHAYDSSGNLAWEDADIWPAASGIIEPGIFIDTSDPDCHMLLMGTSNLGSYYVYWARYNNGGSQKTTSWLYEIPRPSQGEGCVQVQAGEARFVCDTSDAYGWTSTVIPNW